MRTRWQALSAIAALLVLASCKPAAMVTVPEGWFLMGDPSGDGASSPQRRVWLSAFAIDRTEVTYADYARFVAQSSYQPQAWQAGLFDQSGDEPVVGVSWRDADAYCRWKAKRLPTEAEWEKAARGADGRRYPWGAAWDRDLANTSERGEGGVLPVGTFPAGASPYGALDMAGNAAEWVVDFFDGAYYTYGPDRDPPGPTKVANRVLRGGSWALPAEYAQTFFRDSSHGVTANPRAGFRCAQSR